VLHIKRTTNERRKRIYKKTNERNGRTRRRRGRGRTFGRSFYREFYESIVFLIIAVGHYVSFYSFEVIAGSTVDREFVDGVILVHLSHGSFAVGCLLFLSFSDPLACSLSCLDLSVPTGLPWPLSFPTLISTPRRYLRIYTSAISYADEDWLYKDAHYHCI
jgi:hypothetical protein